MNLGQGGRGDGGRTAIPIAAEFMGLVPGAEFEAVGSTAIDSLIHLKIGDRPYTVGAEVARHLWVVPV